MAKLLYNTNEYSDKTTGEIKTAYNYYVLYNGAIKVQLRPADFTGRELLDAMRVNGEIDYQA